MQNTVFPRKRDYPFGGRLVNKNRDLYTKSRGRASPCFFKTAHHAPSPGQAHLETVYPPDRMTPAPSRVKAPLPTIGGVPSSLLPCWVAPAPHRLMCAVEYGRGRPSTHIILRNAASTARRGGVPGFSHTPFPGSQAVVPHTCSGRVPFGLTRIGRSKCPCPYPISGVS